MNCRLICDAAQVRAIQAGATQVRVPLRLSDSGSRFQPGDVLSVRESWQKCTGCNGPENGGVIYWADYGVLTAHKWRSATTMPLWAVRFSPPVLSVRCERVAEITGADALACGYTFPGRERMLSIAPIEPVSDLAHLRNSARALWESRHGKRHPWDTSWAWVLGI